MVNNNLNISIYDFAKNYCCFKDETGVHRFDEFQLSHIMEMQEMMDKGYVLTLIRSRKGDYFAWRINNDINKR